MTQHTIDYRVYYEDTDAGGIMYHANFIKFCERGRTEFLRHIGFENQKLAEDPGILFVVRQLNAEYLLPGRLDDLLTVKTAIKTLNNSSFIMKQSIFRHDSMLFTMDITLVCINLQARPVRVPEMIRPALEQFLNVE